ncbi:hypothetical protein ATANTOWER_025416, partial [Ataeniobius toweri]|nr:hypothetical protein [Ataeniobius toweri]
CPTGDLRGCPDPGEKNRLTDLINKDCSTDGGFKADYRGHVTDNMPKFTSCF